MIGSHQSRDCFQPIRSQYCEEILTQHNCALLNKALTLDVESHETSFNQLEWFISAQCSDTN